MSGYYRRRLRLLLAIVAATTLFLLVGRWARVPYYPGFEVALLTMPAPAARTGVVMVTLITAVAIGTLIAGGVRTEIGLFAAAVGLCSLSTRAGPMQYVWMHEELGGLSSRLAMELALLGLTILALWTTLSLLARRGNVMTRLSSADETASPAKSDGFAAFAVHLIVTGLLIALLLPADAKKQAIVGIALASCIGALASSLSVPAARLGLWLFAPPILIGILGYLLGGNPLQTNGGFFTALLRAAPIDYAGAGTAGSILGRWLAIASEPDASIRTIAFRPRSKTVSQPPPPNIDNAQLSS